MIMQKKKKFTKQTKNKTNVNEEKIHKNKNTKNKYKIPNKKINKKITKRQK